MNGTEVSTPADDATVAAVELVLGSDFSPARHQRTPADSRRARPNPAWWHERHQHTLLPGKAGSPRHRAQATGRALTVGPAQSLEKQVSLHADSRHGESRTLRLRHVPGLRRGSAKDPPLLPGCLTSCLYKFNNLYSRFSTEHKKNATFYII